MYNSQRLYLCCGECSRRYAQSQVFLNVLEKEMVGFPDYAIFSISTARHRGDGVAQGRHEAFFCTFF